MPETRYQPLSDDEVRLLNELDPCKQVAVAESCSPLEIRKHRRQEFYGTLTARRRQLPSEKLDLPVTVQGRDFSLGGVQFVSAIPFPPESQLELFFQLPLWGSRRFVRMLAEVRHVTESENGDWFIGCKFLDTLAAWPR